MQKWVFINDDFIAEEKACIHFRDLAIQRGYGVFDYLRLKDNTPVFLNDHLERFFHSAQQMHLPVGKTEAELKNILADLIAKNSLPDSGIRLTLTGGYSADGYQIAEPNLIISQQKFQALTTPQFEHGIRLITYKHQRQLPSVKTIDYVMPIWLQPYIKKNGADDVLYFNDNMVTECPRSNFFLVTNEDKIITSKDNILHGITRKKLLEIAAKEFEIAEGNITPGALTTGKEAFITSTTKSILPVTSVNGNKMGNGTAGAVTKKLLQLWQSALQ
ncbi:MAG: aminotransferase class IV [Flavisolibacter sp.]|jgi:D-alanine transaminase/branched-chain amino acid aminotransferase